MKFAADTDKSIVFRDTQSFLEGHGFKMVDKDDTRPWGGFFCIAEKQAAQFITSFFPHLSLLDFKGFDKLSPKILLVAPNKRLSWQYHHRRSEIWKVIGGRAGVVVSESRRETPIRHCEVGTDISLPQGYCHRLVGLDVWGVIAEIWQHTDPANPSDEDDIVRVQDDFGR